MAVAAGGRPSGMACSQIDIDSWNFPVLYVYKPTFTNRYLGNLEDDYNVVLGEATNTNLLGAASVTRALVVPTADKALALFNQATVEESVTSDRLPGLVGGVACVVVICCIYHLILICIRHARKRYAKADLDELVAQERAQEYSMADARTARKEAEMQIMNVQEEAITKVKLAQKEAEENIKALQQNADKKVELGYAAADNMVKTLRQEADNKVTRAQEEANTEAKLAELEADKKAISAQQEGDRKVESIRRESEKKIHSAQQEADEAGRRTREDSKEKIRLAREQAENTTELAEKAAETKLNIVTVTYKQREQQLQDELSTAKTTIDQLQAYKDNAGKQSKEVVRLQNELSNKQKARLEEVAGLIEKHGEDLEDLRRKHHDQLDALQKQQYDATESLDQEWSEEVQRLQEEQDSTMEDMEEQHRNEIRDLQDELQAYVGMRVELAGAKEAKDKAGEEAKYLRQRLGQVQDAIQDNGK